MKLLSLFCVVVEKFSLMLFLLKFLFIEKFGGVVPEIASCKHIVNIMPVLDEALHKANVTLQDIDRIAVAYGPGLVGALLVGVSAAKTLAFALDKPLVGVNHLEGHIFANFLSISHLNTANLWLLLFRWCYLP